MCNEYALVEDADGIMRWVPVPFDRNRTGNLPPLPGIFPDQMAPVVRKDRDGGLALELLRWGFPPPPNLGTRPITNIRNTKSPYWRAWLKPEFRCLVPATSFCEWTDSAPKVQHWFGLGPERPLFAFAGLWRPWTGVRKGEEKEHHLFAFLTTEPNDVVRPIHSKAMPVMLVDQAACDAWLEAPIEEALAMQRPLDPALLSIVAKGTKTDARAPS